MSNFYRRLYRHGLKPMTRTPTRKCPNCGRRVEIWKTSAGWVFKPHAFGAMMFTCIFGGKLAPRPPQEK